MTRTNGSVEYLVLVSDKTDTHKYIPNVGYFNLIQKKNSQKKDKRKDMHTLYPLINLGKSNALHLKLLLLSH